MSQQRAIYIDLRPERPWVAVVSGLEAPFIIEGMAPAEGYESLRGIAAHHNPKARYTRAIIGVYPGSRFIRHATLENPSKAREDAFFEDYLKTHYQIDLAESSVMVLNPATGIPVDLEKVVPKELLFAGAKQADIVQLQADLVAHTLYPERLELGSLATLGGVMHYQRVQQIGSSAVVLEWGEDHSLFTICSAKRVELSRVIPFGTRQLIAQIKNDLGLKDEQSAERILATGSFDFVEMGAMILKRYIKELQASAGFFEVQTGQALKHFVITLLPQRFSWVEQVLAQYLGLDLLAIDYTGWANTLGLKVREGAADFAKLSREHLGLISLMVQSSTDGEKKSS